MSVWKDPSGRWHVSVSHQRRRLHRRCPPGALKADALRLEGELRRQLWRALELGDRQEVLIEQAVTAHLEELRAKRSHATAQYHAYRLAPFIAGRPIFAAPDCAAAMLKALRTEYAPATLNRSLAALKRACRIAWERGWVDHDVSGRIRLLPERNARERYLTRAQLEQLAAHDPQIADAVRILAYTGMRLGELLGLQPHQVTDTAILLDARTKTGKPRRIPIARAIRAAVRRLPLGMARRTLQQRFTAAAAGIGLPGLRLHDLRHTTASLLAQEGVPLQVIGALLGHTSPQTTARYAHLVQEQLEKAVRKLG